MAIDDRKQLTFDEAYELVKRYVHVAWIDYRHQLQRSMDEEDCVQTIMLKLLKKNDNPDYDPDWKPGEPAKFYKTRSRGDDVERAEVDTEYMLKPDYNPDDPFDSIYHLMTEPTFNYLTKYNGRTTSKAYYIKKIVDLNMIDLTRKKDVAVNKVSLDAPISNGDSDDKEMTQGDRIADPDAEEEIYKDVDTSMLHDILVDILNSLDAQPLSDRIVGYSPIAGISDAEGNQVETPLTARDIGLYIMYDYTPEDLTKIYKDKKNGAFVSLATIKKRWKEAMDMIKQALLNNKKLRKLGVLDHIMNKMVDNDEI